MTSPEIPLKTLPILSRVPLDPPPARPSMMECPCGGWVRDFGDATNDHHKNCVHRSFVAYCLVRGQAGGWMYLGQHHENIAVLLQAELEVDAEGEEYDTIELVPYLSSKYEESVMPEFEGW